MPCALKSTETTIATPSTSTEFAKTTVTTTTTTTAATEPTKTTNATTTTKIVTWFSTATESLTTTSALIEPTQTLFNRNKNYSAQNTWWIWCTEQHFNDRFIQFTVFTICLTAWSQANTGSFLTLFLLSMSFFMKNPQSLETPKIFSHYNQKRSHRTQVTLPLTSQRKAQWTLPLATKLFRRCNWNRSPHLVLATRTGHQHRTGRHYGHCRRHRKNHRSNCCYQRNRWHNRKHRCRRCYQNSRWNCQNSWYCC